MPYIDQFQYIVDCHFGGRYLGLVFSPVYEQDGTGWGAPFQSGDPLTDVNPPFGTVLTSTDTHDKRHKIAKLSADSITQQFGVQHEESSIATHMGNSYWSSKTTTDEGYSDVDIVSWWGIPGNGANGSPEQVNYVYYCSRISIGDVIATPTAYSGAGRDQYSVITGRKATANCVGGVTNNVDLLKLNEVKDAWELVDLTDLSDHVFVNGVKVDLQGVTTGNSGAFIVGACVFQGWLIYNTVAVYNNGSSKPDEVHAIKLDTLEYKFLADYTTADYTDWWSGGGWYGLRRVAYSQDGSKSVVARHDDEWQQTKFYRVTGVITMGGDSKPAITVSVNYPGDVPGPYSYGYKDNTEVFRWPAHPYGTTISYVTHSNEQYGFLCGFTHYRKVCDSIARQLPANFFVQYEGDVYYYPVSASTGLPAFTTQVSSGSSIEDYSWAESAAGANYSAIAWEGGVILSIGSIEQWGPHWEDDDDPIPGDCAFVDSYPYHNVNVWIQTDGTVVDLGETLLNDTVNGSDLSMRPMTLQIIGD